MMNEIGMFCVMRLTGKDW